MRERTAPPSGVLVVHKPSGPTSHDLVAAARRVYRTREVGHAGTLDPMASGVLLLLLGEGTKLSQWLTGNNKSYRATIRFGRSTDTLDALGATVEERELSADWLSRAALDSAFEAEMARSLQVPPDYSAIKVDGRRAHRAVRAGEPLELAPRSVHIEALSLLSWSNQEVVVALNVSKGYYVRAFARDVGLTLGVPAHLSGLVRTSSGPFSLDEAHSWPLECPVAPLPVAEAAQRALPVATLTPEGLRRARFGQLLQKDDFLVDPESVHGGVTDSSPVTAWFDPMGTLVALGERDDQGYRVKRGFQSPMTAPPQSD